MTTAKDLIVRPISPHNANMIVKKLHYSNKVVPNSQLHFGVFLNGKCGGAIQLGPSMRKDLLQPLVKGTQWNGFIELHRLAFADWLPRNGESRCIGYVMRVLRKTYKHLKWVISFADGCQCGDGAIYRASGFVLTQIKRNNQMRVNPVTGDIVHTMTAFHGRKLNEFRQWRMLDGFMLRYIYFLDPEIKKNLTCPILPFSEIKEKGASIYKGVRM